MRKLLLAALLFALPQTGLAAPQDIVDTAESNGSFTTLTELLEEAGLTETLKGDGPFTVFAPTDDAFAKVPAETLAALKADKARLAKVLKYHVVSGKVDSKAVIGLDSAQTVAGERIILNSASGVRVNNAQVVTPDVVASNGVIHVIDTVLIPKG